MDKVNVLKQELIPLQQPSPQYDVPPQQSSPRSSPQPCPGSRVVTAEEIMIRTSAGMEIPLDVSVYMEERIEVMMKPERVTL